MIRNVICETSESGKKNPIEIIFTDNFGRFVYSTLFINWEKELGSYLGKIMQIADEQAQWIAANRSVPGETPEDILQELRILMYKNLKKYSPTKSAVSSFVKVISFNHLTNLYIKSQTHKRKSLNNALPFEELD